MQNFEVDCVAKTHMNMQQFVSYSCLWCWM